MKGKPTKRAVFGRPSWRIAAGEVEAWLTADGGHLAPVTFALPGGRKVRPYHVAPWHAEKLPADTPAAVRILRGDFFCLPFGGNATPYGKERHPLHGETAGGRWTLESFERSRDHARLHASMKTRVRRGRVDKHVEVRRGHSAVYCRHVVSGMSGPMPLGHHATLRFPPAEAGGGVVSVSRFVFGQTFPGPVERPENRGYSILAQGAEFDSLSRVPLITGESADLSRYPARRGFEDIAFVVADDRLPFAWTAAVFPQQRYAWFALRDPRVLRSTMFWFSNGGRHYAPWNGRHVDVLGMEDLTSNFFLGLAESAAPNSLTERGYPTALTLDPKRPLTVNYIMAVADLPVGFDEVAEIEPDGGRGVRLVARNGMQAPAAVDLSFLRSDGGKDSPS